MLSPLSRDSVGMDQEEQQPEIGVLKFDLPPGSHEPMTLDQFFYPTLDNDDRDNDQVVTRYVAERINKVTGSKSESAPTERA